LVVSLVVRILMSAFVQVILSQGFRGGEHAKMITKALIEHLRKTFLSIWVFIEDDHQKL